MQLSQKPRAKGQKWDILVLYVNYNQRPRLLDLVNEERAGDNNERGLKRMCASQCQASKSHPIMDCGGKKS